jgi:SagB-type dehydrogenase family enzyme
MTMSSTFGLARTDGTPVAELFHENSKLPPRVAGARTSGEPDPYPTCGEKSYRTGAQISLPLPVQLSSGLTEALKNRRSVRDYPRREIEIWQLGQVLGWSYGIMDRDGGEMANGRSAPSAGALYPIDIYAVAQRVSGLAEGVYHYDPRTHALEMAMTDGIAAIQAASLYPEITSRANVVLVMVAVFRRTCLKYGERGYRFVLLDCGHIAQNLHLVSTAVGLGSVGIGGFVDDDLNRALELDGVDEAVVHTMTLGPLAT